VCIRFWDTLYIFIELNMILLFRNDLEINDISVRFIFQIMTAYCSGYLLLFI
jgi:hypothetical protein